MDFYYSSSDGLRQFVFLEWLWKVTVVVEGQQRSTTLPDANLERKVHVGAALRLL